MNLLILCKPRATSKYVICTTTVHQVLGELSKTLYLDRECDLVTIYDYLKTQANTSDISMFELRKISLEEINNIREF